MSARIEHARGAVSPWPARWISMIGVLALGFALAGCGPDPRVAPLQAEIAALEGERVEPNAVERAKADADAASADMEQARAKRDALGEHLGALRQEIASLEAAISRESRSTVAEYAAATALEEQLRNAATRGRALDERIAEIRARAELRRDQVALLAKEIRPNDPAWAIERRVRTLDELLAKLLEEYPDDRVLADVAAKRQSGLRAKPDERDTSHAAADAVRVRDHLTGAYDLGSVPTPAVATAAP